MVRRAGRNSQDAVGARVILLCMFRCLGGRNEDGGRCSEGGHNGATYPISEEKHHCTWVVELVHGVEVRHFGDVHEVHDCKVLHLVRDGRQRLVHLHARIVAIVAEADDDNPGLLLWFGRRASRFVSVARRARRPFLHCGRQPPLPCFPSRITIFSSRTGIQHTNM
jgi:hypothetical protein